MKRTFIFLNLLIVLTLGVNAQKINFYVTGGYTFTRAPLKDVHEFIGLYNENPNKIHGYVFTHGFGSLKCLNGIYLGGGMNFKGIFLAELNYTQKYRHTFAYYDPANNPDYLRVELGYSISTVEAAFLVPYSFGKLTVAPGIGMGFLSRKMYYWDDDSLMIAPKRRDMSVESRRGSFSLDPMLQVSYKPFRKIPVEFVARTYYQAMFSKMSVSWLGDFEGYWSPADTASKKVTGGNLGIILAIKVNIPEISFKHRSKNVEPVVIEPVYEEKTNFVLSGTVQDAKTSLPLNAVITLYQGTNPIESVISQSGKFTLKPALNSDYTIETKAFGYQTKTEKLRFDSKSPNPYKYNVKLSKIPAGQAIVLENILFEKSSAVLLPESYTELNKLLQFMNDDSEIRIEIAGHTSSDGDDAYNMKLSQDRANSVATYLINKGIDKTRIVAKGYGETMPVASNDTEEGRRLNRRVEFKIVK